MQLDMDELEETEDYFEEDDDLMRDDDEEGVQRARLSLASIFGEAEVMEVDEAQQDESLLVRTAPL